LESLLPWKSLQRVLSPCLRRKTQWRGRQAYSTLDSPEGFDRQPGKQVYFASRSPLKAANWQSKHFSWRSTAMPSSTPKEIQIGDWFALGQLFYGPFHFDDPKSGTPCAQKFGVNIGVQVLAAMDVVSQYALHGRPVEKTPSPFTAAEILAFLREVFDRHGLPRVGVLLSQSAWQSSAEMLLDDQVAQRAGFLRELDIDFGPMDIREKDKIVASLRELGLRVEFDEDRMSSV
jgi:hypothetical protein